MSEAINPPVVSIHVAGLITEVTGPLATITQAMHDAQANTAAKLVLYHASQADASRTEAELVTANLALIETAHNTYQSADTVQRTAEESYLAEIQLVLSMIQPAPTVPSLPIPLPG